MSRERSLRLPYILVIEENDGPAFLKKGPDRTETPLSWAEVCRAYPRLALRLLDEMTIQFKAEVQSNETAA